MVEIRFHGRGGQGAVVGAKVLAVAGFHQGMYVQSFPFFGAERRGAPVTAFTRLDNAPLWNRSQVYTPTHLIVLDASLLKAGNITAGLQPGGWVLINSPLDPAQVPIPPQFRVATVDADAIARRYHLGPATAPIVNTAILGAFARISGLVSLEAVLAAIKESIPYRPEENAAAAQEAYAQVRIRPEGMGIEMPVSPRGRLELRLSDLPHTAIAPMPGFKGIPTGAWRLLRPVHENRTPPCSYACPAGEDVAVWMSLLSQGRLAEAQAKIWQRNPFPAITGRVCPHPCEEVCNRAEQGGPLAIHLAERFLGDWQTPQEAPEAGQRPQSTGARIAIVGSGPAGLAAAWFLGNYGHRPTIFEAQPQVGGLLRYGIPAYRLPPEVLDREIARLAARGVEIKANQPVSDLADLRRHYDAVLLAIGQSRSRRLGIPGEAEAGVTGGLEFLRQAFRANRGLWQGKRVVIVGGGNTALDAARTVLRLGGQPLILYRRTRDQMPAIASEVEEAIEEGVTMRFLAAPVRILHQDGRVIGLVCQEMRLAQADATGRPQAVPVPASEFTVPCEALIAAVGQEAQTDWLPEALRGGPGISTDAFGTTALPGVFACGDVATGAGTVAAAIASGRRAAQAIHAFLTGSQEWKEAPLSGERLVRPQDINWDYFLPLPRVSTPQRPAAERVASFAEVNLGLTEKAVLQEAARCLSCGTCNACDNCYIFCPDAAVSRQPDGTYQIDLTTCKGCGICYVECPRHAISLVEEVTGAQA